MKLYKIKKSLFLASDSDIKYGLTREEANKIVSEYNSGCDVYTSFSLISMTDNETHKHILKERYKKIKKLIK